MLPDGTIGNAPLTLTGLNIPNDLPVTADSTYRDVYIALFDKYNFPK